MVNFKNRIKSFIPNYQNNDDSAQPGMTIGQQFDIIDAGADTVFKGFRGGTGSGVVQTSIFGVLDAGISAGSSKPGEMGGRTVGAVAAVGTGYTGYYAGKWIGKGIGALIGGAIGNVPGAAIGGALGSFTGGMLLPYAIDPYVRKISKPINRLIMQSNRHVNFGGNFRDSAPAYTMRMRALQELEGGVSSATQWLGREAQLMHA